MPLCTFPCNRRFIKASGLRIHLGKKPQCRERMLALSGMFAPAQSAEAENMPDKVQPTDELESRSTPDTAAEVRAGLSEPDPSKISEVNFPEDAGTVIGVQTTSFQQRKEADDVPEFPFYPFVSETDWELACWISRSGMSQSHIDEFFKLLYVKRSPPSFNSAARLYYLLESMPGGSEWMSQPLDFEDAAHKPIAPVTLFWRDPIQCVKDLLSNPLLSAGMAFAPRRCYEDGARTKRVYSEMCSGDWWWHTQTQLGKSGATIIPIILGSDKTHLTKLGGDKEAWPLYMTIGNIASDIRSKANSRALVLIAYLPIPKFGQPPEIEKALRNRVYHQCVTKVLETIKACGDTGLSMADSQGRVRDCYTLLASHIGDYPEKLLVAASRHSHSPVLIASQEESFDSEVPGQPRTREYVQCLLVRTTKMVHPERRMVAYLKRCRPLGLSGVHKPYWLEHRYAEPSLLLTPEILHTLHKCFRDHILSWVRYVVGPDELDRRLKVLPHMVGYRHWLKGISHITQWTGREDRELQRCILAAAAGSPNLTARALQNLRACLDFIYLAQYKSHSVDTLRYMATALSKFHSTKDEWIDLGARRGTNGVINHFKIPKIYSWHEFGRSIRELGSSVQFSADVTERAHRTRAKIPFEATNKKNFTPQMCRYLSREEKVLFNEQYFSWRMVSTSTLEPKPEHSKSYLAAVNQGRVIPMRGGYGPLSMPRKGPSPYIRVGHPVHSGYTVEDVTKQFGLPDLRAAIADFLSGESKKSHNRRVAKSDACLPPEFDAVSVWNKFYMSLPAVQDEETILPPRTILAYPPDNEYPLGNCYPVLICDNDDAQTAGIDGYLVGLVRCIFSACSDTSKGRYLRDPHRNPILAYVQWFSKPGLEQGKYDSNLKMFIVRPTFRSDGSRIGDVVELESIVWPLQLIPKFGKAVDASITHQNVYSVENMSYFVNSFWDKEVYQAVY